MDNPLLSVVVPYYRKLEHWTFAMQRQHALASPDIEIVLVLDDAKDYHHVLYRVKYWFKQYKFRVILNDELRDWWKTPSVPINVGIRNSLANIISVMSPESIVLVPEKGYLETKCRELTTNRYILGSHTQYSWALAQDIDDFGPEYKQRYESIKCKSPYGFFLTTRNVLESIGGYDESQIYGGGEDDRMRVKVRALVKAPNFIVDKQIRVAHITHDSFKHRWVKTTFDEKLIPKEWGRAYNKVIYDWRTDS